MSAIPGGAVDLDRRAQLPIKETRLLHLAGANLKAGGLDSEQAVAHLRVVDVPNLTVLLIPMDRASLERIISEAEAVRDSLPNPEQNGAL